jgi:arsenate reductase
MPNPPADLVRRDKHFAALGLDAAELGTREAVVELLLQHPKLMQRPVVTRNGKAVIARPSEKVLELFQR